MSDVLEFERRREIQERLRKRLAAEHEKRAERLKRVGVTAFDLEVAAMTDEINAIRAERGLRAIRQGEVERAESGALGHSDYARKFAWYASELCAPDQQASE